MLKRYFLPLLLIFSNQVIAQIQIRGSIKDAISSKPLIGVSVMVKGKQIGTITDKHGDFQLSTSQPLPFRLSFSSIGYKTQELGVNETKKNLLILLQETATLTPEVVVSASRMEESSLTAPTTIETMNVKTIRESTALNFYDEIRNLKGVDFTTNSVFFSSVNI
ncbi:MAG: carboxypeptidase-like regulatory domain-containing protein, partial [Bacteroidota bacterium]